MNFIGLSSPDEEPQNRAPERREPQRTPGDAPAPGGSDASDILPDELLERRVESYERPKPGSALSPRLVRGEFELLQRELATKIERFDTDCSIAFEDDELVVYALSRRKDLAYVLDYCEIENRLLRGLLLELLADIAAQRTETTPEHPLVIRKPESFRAGERHALGRLFGSTPDDVDTAEWVGRLLGEDVDDGPEPSV